MPEIKQSDRLRDVLQSAMIECTNRRHEFLMPEHLLLALFGDDTFFATLSNYCYIPTLRQKVDEVLQTIEGVDDAVDYTPETSNQMGLLLTYAYNQVLNSSAEAVDISHVTMGLLQLEDSWGAYLLKKALDGKEEEFLSELISEMENSDMFDLPIDEEGEPSADGWRKLVTCQPQPAYRARTGVGAHHSGALSQGEEQSSARRRAWRGQDGTRLWTYRAHRAWRRACPIAGK